ncbi:hypothetical protein FH584_01465 [Leptospira interrogans]|uniref:hypothetical protein n=1 Tax=Leptospira interrogans TaxID=173 RepID=UPI001EF01C3D|nr:hypothetical protein [Leptospira interrogans]ULG92629.1 hypothetical protein FH584_01465 [Leptospira interrogans]
MATTPGRNLRRFQVRQLYISLIAGYILLKKNNQVRVKPKKQERSRVSSWPFLFQERSFRTMVGSSSTNKQRFYDQSKKSQASTFDFLRLEGRSVITPKESQFNGHSLVLNYFD